MQPLDSFKKINMPDADSINGGRSSIGNYSRWQCNVENVETARIPALSDSSRSSTIHGNRAKTPVKESDLTCSKVKPKIGFKLLQADEKDIIQQFINSQEWRTFHCAQNILHLLELLPEHIGEKLKVVLITHNSLPFAYYKGRPPYGYHVFLLGRADNGLFVFDPANPNPSSINSYEWFNNCISGENVEYTLKYDRTLDNLPQFRFIDSSVYRESKDLVIKKNLAPLAFPDYLIKRGQKGLLTLNIWKNSVFLNLHEAYQFFLSRMSFEKVAEFHQAGLVSPNSRLSDDHIDELKSYFIQ